MSVSFTCAVPLACLFDAMQVSVPMWALVHIPVLVTLTTAAFTPRVCALPDCRVRPSIIFAQRMMLLPLQMCNIVCV